MAVFFFYYDLRNLLFGFWLWSYLYTVVTSKVGEK